MLLNTAAGIFSIKNPELSLIFNRLHADARLEHSVKELAETKPGDERRQKLNDSARRGLAFAPLDARFYSILGVVEDQEGNREAAKRLHSRALEMLPTALQSLAFRLRVAVGERRFADAVEDLELIARRWKEYWPATEPVLPLIMSDDAAFEKVAERFSTDFVLQRLVVESLVKTRNGRPLAHKLLLDWRDRDVEKLDYHVNALTRQYMNEGAYSQAFMLFLLTRQNASEAGGFVYNGDFSLKTTGSNFNWYIEKQAGVDFQQTERRKAPGENVEPVSTLAVRFLNNPVRFRNIQQDVRLAPGQYQWTIEYGTLALRAPKPIRVRIVCLGTSRNLAMIELGDGDIKSDRETADFTVPASGCPLQRIQFFNDVLAESWRNRYSGTLYIDLVSITQAES